MPGPATPKYWVSPAESLMSAVKLLERRLIESATRAELSVMAPIPTKNASAS
jgi:hypothetical protein